MMPSKHKQLRYQATDLRDESTSFPLNETSNKA